MIFGEWGNLVFWLALILVGVGGGGHLALDEVIFDD